MDCRHRASGRNYFGQLDIESDDSSELSKHNTNSEQSEEETVSDDEYKEINFTGQHCFVGKDKVAQWLAHASLRPKIRTLRKNIVIHPPGVNRVAQNVKIERDCWELFMTPAIIEYIVGYTNIYLDNLRKNYDRKRDCRPTNATALYAFFRPLYMARVKKNQYLSAKELWYTDGSAPDCFRLTMSRERFHLLVRFDDINNRDERKSVDNITHIRQLFEDCQEHYQIGEYCTVVGKFQRKM